MTKNHLTVSPSAGFSLPEVTLAMAIAALGLVSLLGLLPQGLEMSRKTGEITAQRQIVEQVIRSREQSDWSGLAGSDELYFDDQGIPCASGDFNQTYVVNIAVTSDVKLSGNAERYLKKLTMKIATSTKANFDFSAANSAHYRIVTQPVVKTR